MIRNEKVSGVWKTIYPPKMYEGRPKLTYDKIFVPDDEYIRNTHTLIQLVDGSKFLVSPLETSEVGYTYQIKPTGIDEWSIVYLGWFEPHCLNCELEFIGKELTKLAGTTVGRYVIPIEDEYILITGEDFDGNEDSRIAAGGFIVLVREVQYMAGHKYVSSTERYRTDNLEDLQKELEKYHPLK